MILKKLASEYEPIPLEALETLFNESGRFIGLVRSGHQVIKVDTNELTGCECSDDLFAVIWERLDVTAGQFEHITFWIPKSGLES